LKLSFAEVMANVIAAGRTPVAFKPAGGSLCCQNAENAQRLAGPLALSDSPACRSAPRELSLF